MSNLTLTKRKKMSKGEACEPSLNEGVVLSRNCLWKGDLEKRAKWNPEGGPRLSLSASSCRSLRR